MWHICYAVSLRTDLTVSLATCAIQSLSMENNVDTSGQWSKEICSAMSACVMGMKTERRRRERQREEGGRGKESDDVKNNE